MICMSNTHNGLRLMHQMHTSGKKICQLMLNVCLYKCKESSDLNFRGKLRAIYSAYLIINIVWYFQKKCDIDILTIFWKWHDNCITIYCQTIFWGLAATTFRENRHHHERHFKIFLLLIDFKSINERGEIIELLFCDHWYIFQSLKMEEDSPAYFEGLAHIEYLIWPLQ